MWILGHPYVFWGALRAAVHPVGGKLGYAREEVLVKWLGERGTLWNGVLPEFHSFSRLDRAPEVLVLHVGGGGGGDDLGVNPLRELISEMKFDLCGRISCHEKYGGKPGQLRGLTKPGLK